MKRRIIFGHIRDSELAVSLLNFTNRLFTPRQKVERHSSRRLYLLVGLGCYDNRAIKSLDVDTLTKLFVSNLSRKIKSEDCSIIVMERNYSSP